MLNIHIGSGKVYFDGWVNIDLESDEADLKHDMRKPLPYEDNTVDFIYNEHFIEHLTVQDGLKVLSDFNRILKKRRSSKDSDSKPGLCDVKVLLLLEKARVDKEIQLWLDQD